MSVSYETRRNIIQVLVREGINWGGRLNDVDFLSRVFDLENMPSKDYRFSDARGDIRQHTVNNPGDWQDDWVYSDDRFNLYKCPDEQFLRFLCEMIHPIVRPDETERAQLLEIFNQELKPEGYEILEKTSVFGKVYYKAAGILPSTIDAINQLKDLAEEINSEYLQRSIVRMLSAINEDPELAIGSSKEFVETICKTILDENGITRTDKENIPKLVKMTLDAVKPGTEFFIDSESERIVVEILGSMSHIVQKIAELRNKHGTGHGKDAEKIKIDPMYATLAVNAAATIALFFYQAHEKYNT